MPSSPGWGAVAAWITEIIKTGHQTHKHTQSLHNHYTVQSALYLINGRGLETWDEVPVTIRTSWLLCSQLS